MALASEFLEAQTEIQGVDPLIEVFINALWLEDGLSKQTLAAYTQDLRAFSISVPPISASRSPIQRKAEIRVESLSFQSARER